MVCLVAGLVSAEAHAQGPTGPGDLSPEAAPPGREQMGVAPGEEEAISPYVERGLLLGPGQAFTTFGLSGSTLPIAGSSVDASISAGFGLTKHLSIDGSFGTLSLSPAARYHSPSVGILWGLVDTESLEVDATTHVTFGVAGESTVTSVEPGVAGVLRLGNTLRLDAATYLPVATEALHVGVRIPLDVSFGLGENVHAVVSTGAELTDMFDLRVPVTIPLGFSLGMTAPMGSGGYAVISPSVSFPSIAEIGGVPIVGPRPVVFGAAVSFVTPP
jgi:hypothetical protein